MSRGFTKEEDSLPAPIVPPRAPLPAGVANYVTPRGLQLLRAELAELESERARLDAAAGTTDAKARTQQLLVVNGRISALTSRLTSARVVDPATQPRDEVRFGATVGLRGADGEERRLTIVGVDEADASGGRVAFTSPIARAIVGKRVGQPAQLRTARGEETVTITSIAYEAE